MNRQRLTLPSVFLLALLLALWASPALAAKPMVYIVHSYEKNHVCGQPQADGIISALKETGLYPGKVAVESYYMDTKITNASPEAIARQGRLAMAEIDRLQPTVVVTLDDNAFAFVGLKLVDRPGISVVFSGMNGQPEMYNERKRFMNSRLHPGHNVTGVYEKLHLKRAINVLKKVINVTKVVGITDYSPTGNGLLRQLEIESAEGLPVDWTVKRVRTFDEYKHLISTINADDSVQAIYPVALALEDHGKRVAASEIFRWTILNSLKPEIPINYSFCEMGLFGGASVDFSYMGKMAGTQVSSILDGGKAGDLPIVDASDYAIVFNTARAAMLHIEIPMEVLLASDSLFKEMPLIQQ